MVLLQDHGVRSGGRRFRQDFVQDGGHLHVGYGPEELLQSCQGVTALGALQVGEEGSVLDRRRRRPEKRRRTE